MTEWFDEDDDEKDKARKLLYWSLTQGLDSVPILGSAVSSVAEKAITGKASYYGSNLFPVLDEFRTGAQQVSTAIQKGSVGDDEAARKAWIKAASNIGEGFGMTFGVPVSGAKELGRVFGIGDGDGELGFNPGAFIGRR
jgi:hypothetical protein